MTSVHSWSSYSTEASQLYHIQTNICFCTLLEIFSELLWGYKRKRNYLHLAGRFCPSLTPYGGIKSFGQGTEHQEDGWSSALAAVMKTVTLGQELNWLGVKVGQPFVKLLSCFQQKASCIRLFFSCMKGAKYWKICQVFVLKCKKIACIDDQFTLWCCFSNTQIILIITELVCNEDSQIIYCGSANKQLWAFLYKSCSLFCLILFCSLFSPCSWDDPCHRNVKKLVKSASSVHTVLEKKRG